jgi:hypothetical protein
VDEDFSRALILKIKTVDVDENRQHTSLTLQSVVDHRIASEETTLYTWFTSNQNTSFSKRDARAVAKLVKSNLKNYCSQ